MRLNRTDIFATCAVGIGALAYALWLADIGVPGLGSARSVGIVVLVLGWAASAVAVVPNADALLRASRVYLLLASALGVAALTAGVIVLISANEAMLALLAASTVTMWVLATVRHTLAGRHALAGQAVKQVAPTAETTEERELVGAGR